MKSKKFPNQLVLYLFPNNCTILIVQFPQFDIYILPEPMLLINNISFKEIIKVHEINAFI